MNRRQFLALTAATPAALSTQPKPRLLAVDGNNFSDERTSYVAGQRGPWPIWFQIYHAAACGMVATVNRAVSGADVFDSLRRAPTQVDPLATWPGVEAWLVYWEGSNTLAKLAPAEAWDQHVAYIAARRAAGFARVFVGTVLPGDIEAAYSDEQREAFNALVRQNATAAGASVIDFATMATMVETRIGRTTACLSDAGAELAARIAARQMLSRNYLPVIGA
jgi:hypothetical protein